MRLGDYLESIKMDKETAAQQLEVSYQAVRNWVAGDRTPRPENMVRIEQWSGGIVRPNDFISPAPIGPAKARGAAPREARA